MDRLTEEEYVTEFLIGNYVLLFSPTEAETEYWVNVVQVHQYNTWAITSNDYIIESNYQSYMRIPL